MLKLNTHRTFTAEVVVRSVNEEGHTTKGTFEATFRVAPTTELTDEANAEKRYLDLVLVSVKESDLDITDADGRKLTGEELLSALKADPGVSNALITTYSENVAKKNQKRT